MDIARARAFVVTVMSKQSKAKRDEWVEQVNTSLNNLELLWDDLVTAAEDKKNEVFAAVEAVAEEVAAAGTEQNAPVAGGDVSFSYMYDYVLTHGTAIHKTVLGNVDKGVAEKSDIYKNYVKVWYEDLKSKQTDKFNDVMKGWGKDGPYEPRDF